MKYTLAGTEYLICCCKCKKSLGGRDEPAAHIYADEWMCPRHYSQRYQQLQTVVED